MAKKKRAFERNFDLKSEKCLRRKDAEQALRNIWDEHTRRLGSSFLVGPYEPTKNDSAKNFLRREVYALGLKILSCPSTNWATEDFLAKVRPNLNRPDKLGNVFHDLLMSIYNDDSQISRQERHLMARELEYARRHAIPPELLCGFLYQSGPRTEIRKKLEAGYLEAAFSQA
ncbi:hypothetical protein [Qipengyuania sp. 483]